MTWGFVTCGPNEALVISGSCYDQPLIVPGGRTFVWPMIQRIDRISLNVMTLVIESHRIYTQLGVPITVTGVAQIKIPGNNVKMLATACEQFLGRSPEDIQYVAQETLEGHQRSIMGNMTVEQIYKDRQTFSEKVFDTASSDLVAMGIAVVSYTLKDIHDDEGYLEALGRSRTAQVKKDARIGEAEARKDAGISSAIADQGRLQAKLQNDIEVAAAQRDYELQKAKFDAEVNAERAGTDLAYEIQAAKTRQLIKEEEMQVEIVERTRQIEVEELEVERSKNHLEATVKKQAEAERFRACRLAEANKVNLIAKAEAEAESIRLRGEAEAEAMEAMAKAEAEKMRKKAEAYKQYQGAAKMEMILQALPKVAAEVSAPLASCKKVTMVSNGDGDIGVSKLTGEVLDVIQKIPEVMENMTGVNVFADIQKTQTQPSR